MNSEVKVHVVDGSKFVQEGAAGRRRRRSGNWLFAVGGEVGVGGNVEEEVDRRPEGEGERPRSSVVVEEVAKSPVPQEPRVSPVSRSRLRRAEEGGGGRRKVTDGSAKWAASWGEPGGALRVWGEGAALVGLSCLHLQQSQHGRVVSQFHPPLGGQADVLGQVVNSS